MEFKIVSHEKKAEPVVARLTGLDAKYKFARVFHKKVQGFTRHQYETKKLTFSYTLTDGVWYIKHTEYDGGELIQYFDVSGETMTEISEADALERFNTTESPAPAVAGVSNSRWFQSFDWYEVGAEDEIRGLGRIKILEMKPAPYDGGEAGLDEFPPYLARYETL